MLWVRRRMSMPSSRLSVRNLGEALNLAIHSFSNVWHFRTYPGVVHWCTATLQMCPSVLILHILIAFALTHCTTALPYWHPFTQCTCTPDPFTLRLRSHCTWTPSPWHPSFYTQHLRPHLTLTINHLSSHIHPSLPNSVFPHWCNWRSPWAKRLPHLSSVFLSLFRRNKESLSLISLSIWSVSQSVYHCVFYKRTMFSSINISCDIKESSCMIAMPGWLTQGIGFTAVCEKVFAWTEVDQRRSASCEVYKKQILMCF